MNDPKDVKEVQCFLGVLNYFKDHLKDFATIADPLRRLTRKNGNFSLNDNVVSAIDKLMKLITAAPILSYFDEKKLSELETDGSSCDIGGALTEIDKNDNAKYMIA